MSKHAEPIGHWLTHKCT